MRFSHHQAIWQQFPALVPWVLYVDCVHADTQAQAAIERHEAIAREHLARQSEGEWPSIQAWRRVFSQMGLKPTQYRCAAESLLRRFRKENALPRLHPLVDLCNAVSLAYGVPIAVFDLDQVRGDLQVCFATGNESYLEFSGALEKPDTGEVIFSDSALQAHARRWCHRQSGLSAIRPTTRRVLIVAEAVHAGADDEMRELATSMTAAITSAWSWPAEKRVHSAMLTPSSPSFIAE